MNKSDSERIASVLEKNNYKSCLNKKRADLIIVNMCSVRQSAVDRIYSFKLKFKKLKEKNPHFKTILTGCISKKDKIKLRQYFDFILSIKTLEMWPEILKGQKNQKPHEVSADYLKIYPKYSTDFSISIPISTGCNNSCTYCIVPFTRGPLICRPHEDIFKEAEDNIKKGIKEIWLLGQNVNDYQSPINPSIKFPGILKKINDIPGNFWIRFTSPNPKDFSEELIETMSKCEKLAEYLNLPVQSGDDELLKKMNRTYTVKQYKDLIDKIRKRIPNIALSTDVIVGFPGETEKQFQNTVNLFKKIKFDMAYIAKYSPRPNTKAAEIEDDVPREKKQERFRILTNVLKKTALENNKNFAGKEIDVLIDKIENNHLYGKTRSYKTVRIDAPEKNIHLGSFIKVKIIKALSWGLKGEII